MKSMLKISLISTVSLFAIACGSSPSNSSRSTEPAGAPSQESQQKQQPQQQAPKSSTPSKTPVKNPTQEQSTGSGDKGVGGTSGGKKEESKAGDGDQNQDQNHHQDQGQNQGSTGHSRPGSECASVQDFTVFGQFVAATASDGINSPSRPSAEDMSRIENLVTEAVKGFRNEKIIVCGFHKVYVSRQFFGDVKMRTRIENNQLVADIHADATDNEIEDLLLKRSAIYTSLPDIEITGILRAERGTLAQLMSSMEARLAKISQSGIRISKMPSKIILVGHAGSGERSSFEMNDGKLTAKITRYDMGGDLNDLVDSILLAGKFTFNNTNITMCGAHGQDKTQTCETSADAPGGVKLEQAKEIHARFNKAYSDLLIDGRRINMPDSIVLSQTNILGGQSAYIDNDSGKRVAVISVNADVEAIKKMLLNSPF